MVRPGGRKRWDWQCAPPIGRRGSAAKPERPPVHQKNTPALLSIRPPSIVCFRGREAVNPIPCKRPGSPCGYASLTPCHDVCLLMPHPNRFPSSPGLRDHSKQALDELSFSRPNPMSRPKPSSFSSSVRRFSSRRPRPSATSIADIFVTSLVLAGLCHEHSPRARGLSTLPLRTTEGTLRRFRSNDLACRSQVPACRRLEFSGHSTQSSRNRSWLSHGFAQAENEYMERSHTRPSIRRTTAEKMNTNFPDLTQTTDEQTENERGKRFRPSISDEIAPTEALAEDLLDDHLSEASVETTQTTNKPALRRDDRVRLAVTQLFRRLLGDEDGLDKVIEAVLPKQTIIRKADDKVDDVEIPAVAALVELLPSSNEVTPQYLFRLYREMPSPGVAHLSKRSRGSLLRRFANPPNRRWADARRFLALVEDMVSTGLPMSRAMWSSAIHMCGRSNNGKVSKRRLVNAIGMWQQMEHVAGIPADSVVFHILCDTAIKANQFMVAERLENEMQKRGIRYSREGFVSKIHSRGIMRDVDGIRQTFDDFVSAGEFVDTVVLNCLMSSFLRAGDTRTAEQIYAQMIQSQQDARESDSSMGLVSTDLPSLSSEFTFYRTKTREMGRMLKMAQSLHNSLPAYHRAVQNALSMTPDTRTFYIILQHYARYTGNLDKFMNVVQDMESTFRIPPRHLIYLLLFEGFGSHGRRRNTAWTAEKLRLTFLGFLRAVRDSRARSQGRSPDTSEMVWENPLKELRIEADVPLNDVDQPDGFYVSLPSKKVGTDETNPIVEAKVSSTDAETVDEFDVPLPPASVQMPFTSETSESSSSPREGLIDEDDRPSRPGNAADETAFEHEPGDAIDGLENFDDPSSPRQLNADKEAELNVHEHEYLAKRLENGVFVGRRMIIVILHAFGTCCGPREVMEAWLQLDQLWPSTKRKAIDEIAIREVLEEQMERRPTPPVRYTDEWGR
ncbi:uncharacterized protein N7459_009322 [Penicillium hispanicum]|uniref:uncharacterized protein n=1 Tax=Penicillium hispanicum TaxID=1080232 RepID=UPI0025417980|nr:uncharacterized protein N7459_009322 [Penicillium hispanicum]KAJ5569892.1 hypothetical protein N7459_009322 [Penicillium hispanicum]